MLSFSQSFSSLSCQNVALVGASGFIGSHLVDALLQIGCNVSALSRHMPGLISPASQLNPLLQCHSFDIRDEEKLDSFICGSDIVIHLASSSLPHNSNKFPHDDVNSNLIGSLNLLEAVRKNHVSKFIFLSSGGTVYGQPFHVPISENHPTDPICSYGITKLAIEKYTTLYSNLYNFKSVILRLANPFGERQRLNSSQGVIPVFLNKAMQNIPLEIWGDGSVVRDFLYVSDAIRAILLACNYEGNHSLFNIGSGEGLSINDLIKLIENLLGRDIKVIYKDSRSCDVPTNVLSIERAKNHLLWSPEVTPSNGLKLLYQYLSFD